MLILIKKVFGAFQPRERRLFLAAAALFVIAAVSRTVVAVAENSVFVPVAGGTYREGVVGQPIFVNPVISANQPDQDIAALVYSRLNQLMENYEIQDDGRTYVVSLKQDLTWSDGQPLTSDDVIFTIKLIQGPETQSPLFTSWQGVAAERVSEIKVRFSLPAPYAFFLEHFARLPVIPAHIFGQVPVPNIKLSNYNLEPVASGSYRFVSFAKRDDGFITEYRLTANENFAGPRPYIENFVFKFYENEDELLEAFRFRRIDGFGSLKPLVFNGLIPKQAVIEKVPVPRYYALFFNPNINPILKDKNFRVALTEAIDKERLVESVFEPDAGAIVTDGPLAQPRQGQPPFAFNQENAREKLADVKRDNLELTIILPTIDFLRKTAAAVQEAWQAVGVPRVNVIELPPNEIVNEVIRSRNYEILLFGQVPEKPEDLFPFWHSSQRFNPGLNLALYNNPDVDKLTERIRQELQNELRPAEVATAEEMIIGDAPAIFLYSLPYLYIHHEDLKGFSGKAIVNPADRFNNIAEWHVISARIIE